jgi:hypothetical protein
MTVLALNATDQFSLEIIQRCEQHDRAIAGEISPDDREALGQQAWRSDIGQHPSGQDALVDYLLRD